MKIRCQHRITWGNIQDNSFVTSFSGKFFIIPTLSFYLAQASFKSLDKNYYDEKRLVFNFLLFELAIIWQKRDW